MSGRESIGSVLEFVRKKGADPSFLRMLEIREAELQEARRKRAIRSRRQHLEASGIDITERDIQQIAEEKLSGVECDDFCRAFEHRQLEERGPDRARPCRDYHADSIVKRWLAQVENIGTFGRIPQFLALCGGTGKGKTVACAWAIAELGTGTAVAAIDLMQARRERDRALRDARLLVIDDLGTEDCEPARFGAALCAVVNQRQRGGRLTLVTTNLSRHALSARYDERTIHRMRALGYFADVLGRNMRTPLE